MPVQVLRGRRDGPRLFVSAAVHGDELNGIEIIRRLLNRPALTRLRGTLIAIPIVNVYGVLHHSRYLPDRRDLNRSFPGSERGSLTAKVADRFMTEIVANCTHGIDLHTAANHRDNLPQIRGNLDDPETLTLAHSFGVPVLINAETRDGSLRAVATEHGIPTLLYEAGEALRFNEVAIRPGVQGILNVMGTLGMLAPSRRSRVGAEPVIARSSAWVRAPESGMFRDAKPLGARVERGEPIATIADPFGDAEIAVTAEYSGLVIGRTQLPIVYQGDALFHVARFEDVVEVAQHVEDFQASHDED
ncbi:MAG: succinylglutamate desuccinylase/aspartoacylase family protein [Actinomycetia bacterium]|nr:succinylglutamate desuccinylase/aspartoacylase family protein [Actinomycetes bacterium]